MVYIYLPAIYYHLNLDVTKGSLLAAGFSAVPVVFLVFALSPLMPNLSRDTGTPNMCFCIAYSLI